MLASVSAVQQLASSWLASLPLTFRTARGSDGLLPQSHAKFQIEHRMIFEERELSTPPLAVHGSLQIKYHARTRGMGRSAAGWGWPQICKAVTAADSNKLLTQTGTRLSLCPRRRNGIAGV